MITPGRFMQWVVLALLGFAVIMVNSAAMTIGPVSNASHHSGPWGILASKQALHALIAIAALFLATRINIKHWPRIKGWKNPLAILVVVSLALVAMTAIPGLGRSVNGATRWLYLGPTHWGVSFQPSELVKWVLVLAIASWCAKRRGVMHRFWDGPAPAIALTSFACGLILLEDLGTAALIWVVSFCLLAAGGARLWHLALTIPPALGALLIAIAQNPYRIDRLTAFIDPWADPQGTGYHPIQSMLAIAQGGLTGLGLGNGIQKLSYLPEDTTDFIFAIVCEELGLPGATLVISLYLILLWAGLKVLRDSQDTFCRLVTLGVLLTIGLQAAINIAVVTVLIPTKGIALPLISAGGTGWVLGAAAIGLVAALDQTNHPDNPTSCLSTTQPVASTIHGPSPCPAN